MAYIGAEPLPGQNREVDDISSSFNGSTTAFTLQVSGVNVSPETANNILVNIGGVIQNPGTDYTIAASTITFTTAPASGLSFFGIILGAGINTATVADQTIGTSKILDNAVTADKLAHTSVTAGSYTTADITVDAQGRITAAANGTIATAEIADGAINNAKVNASAAIAGTKISPDFGSQNIVTTGDANINGGDLTVTGGEGVSAVLKLVADQGDDNGDGWRLISNQDDNDLTISNNISGSYADKLTLKNNGDLHILDKIIHDGDTNTAIRFPSADTVSVETAGSERLTVQSDGDIGLATTSPNASGFSGPTVSIGKSGNPYSVLELQGNNTSDGSFGIIVGYNSGGSARTTQINMNRQAANNSGAISFETASAGSLGERVRITNDGLTFNGDTATANALTDYEEGTFSLAASAMGVTNTDCKYVKIGRLVHCTGRIATGSSGNGSLVAQFSGLPFAGQSGTVNGGQGGTVPIHDVGVTLFTSLVSNSNMRMNNDTGSATTQSVIDDKQMDFNITYYTT